LQNVRTVDFITLVTIWIKIGYIIFFNWPAAALIPL